MTAALVRSAGPDFDALPDELKPLRRWVLWDAAERDGKTTKKPRQSTADPDSWLSFDHAFGAWLLEGATGIGFVLGDGVVGLDIDGCLNASGKLHEVAHDALKLNSYAETSPSGRGIHVLLRATIERSRKVGKRGDRPGIEIYDGREGSARFFACTGRRLSTSTGLARDEAAQRALDIFVAKWLPPEPLVPALHVVPETVAAGHSDKGLDDNEVLAAMFGAKDGAKWKAIFNGDHSSYPSQSEADLGMCRKIRFYARGDAAQIDRLFRRSRLMRTKWDERHGASTYGQFTIAKALTAGGPVRKVAASVVLDHAIRADWERKAWARLPLWWVERLHGAGELACRVLAVIAVHADADTGLAYPSIETVAILCGVTIRRVKDALPILKQRGLLTWERRYRQSNVYRVAFMVSEASTTDASPADQSMVSETSTINDADGALMVLEDGHLSGTTGGPLTNEQRVYTGEEIEL